MLLQHSRLITCLTACWLLVSAGSGLSCFAQTKTAARPALAHYIRQTLLINWLGNQALSAVLSVALSAKLHGWTVARVKTADITDAFKGDFQSLDVSCRGGTYKGMSLGVVHVHGGPLALNYRTRANQRRGLRAPLLVSIDGLIRQGDLSRDLESKDVAANLRFLKFEMPGLGEQHLQVLKPHVEIDNDKVLVSCRMVTAGADPSTGISLRVNAVPELDRQRYVRLRNLEILSNDVNDPVHFGPFLETLFNPLVDFARLDRYTHSLRLNNLEVKDGNVRYSARLWLAPKHDDKTENSAPYLMAHPEVHP